MLSSATATEAWPPLHCKSNIILNTEGINWDKEFNSLIGAVFPFFFIIRVLLVYTGKNEVLCLCDKEKKVS